MVRLFKFLWRLTLVLALMPVLVIFALKYINPPTTAFMLESRLDAQAHHNTLYTIDYRFTPYRNISPHLKLAVIASEDQHFPIHHGFDFDQIDKAWQEHEKGGRQRGASTISQQTVKNLFLWGSPSFIRKGIEAYLTVWLEVLLPKSRILEIYLNVAEFAPGVYGVGAAAPRLFHTTPDHLSREQAALLTVVLPSPKHLHADKPTAYMVERQQWVIDQMNKLGGLAVLNAF